MESKSTLYLYRNKVNIGDQELYENGWDSVILMRCRTNTLKLNWRARFAGGDVTCGMSGGVEENLEHFLLRCRELRVVREKFGVTDSADMKEILLFGEVSRAEVRRCREYVSELWRRRSRMMGGHVVN